ncbi:MAG: hypothetical protein ACPG5U_04780 [Planktomarina sp.]
MAKMNKYQMAVQQAEDNANATRVENDGFVLHEYPDYKTYRDVQVAGNKAKLNAQFVPELHVRKLSRWLNAKLGRPVEFGICHGTRQGKEQMWFKKHLQGDPNVIGTDISETCLQFPDSMIWDFHEENPEWEGKADFIYSNSWDHAYDPIKAFRAWDKCLKPTGVLILDHTTGQQPQSANALDPFGATLGGLFNVVEQAVGTHKDQIALLDYREKNPEYPARVLIVRKPSALRMSLACAAGDLDQVV